MHHYHDHHSPIWFGLFSLAFLAGAAALISLMCAPARGHSCPEGFPPGTEVLLTSGGGSGYIQACWGPDVTVARYEGSFRILDSIDARALIRARK